ncbi:MAG TPA: XRE family transcriptional regulator [Solirubrobacterales bacterium]|nr:XRE family transcriptional regulator [Solirubrobacterales bacterium]
MGRSEKKPKYEPGDFRELSDELRKDPEAAADMDARKAGLDAAMRLAELRESRKQTQAGLAKILGTSQANVSRMERSENPYLETLADFVGALGARLEINAVFEDEVVPLKVFEGEVETPTTPTR